MNLAPSINSSPSLEESEVEKINFIEYIDILFDNRWLVAAIVSLALLMGAAYAILGKPIYEANFAVQVEDTSNSAGSFLGDAAASLLSVKTPAAGEIEIIHSRLILEQAVENTKLYISAQPRYIPVVGDWLARGATDLSEPGFLGFSGYVSGAEKIAVPQFDVPTTLEKSKFYLTILDAENYELRQADVGLKIKGRVGELLNAPIPGGGG